MLSWSSLQRLLVRYHGVLAPAQGRGWLAAGETHHARQRKQIVPAPTVADEPSLEPTAVAAPQARAHRLTWACLLARVFDIDGSLCPACGGRMRLIAALTDSVSIRHYLKGTGLPADPPTIAPPRPPPQRELDFAA